MAEELTQLIDEMRDSPFKGIISNTLRDLSEKAQDGLSAEEIKPVVDNLNAVGSPDSLVLSASQKEAVGGLVTQLNTLTTLKPAEAQATLNGFVEMLDADTEEKVRESARKAREPAPDFFTNIIGFILGALGLDQNLINTITGQLTDDSVEAKKPEVAAPEVTTPEATPEVKPAAQEVGAGAPGTAGTSGQNIASGDIEGEIARRALGERRFAAAAANRTSGIDITVIQNVVGKAPRTYDSVGIMIPQTDEERIIEHLVATKNAQRLKAQQEGAGRGSNDHNYYISDKQNNTIPIVDYYGLPDDIALEEIRASRYAGASYSREALDTKLLPAKRMAEEAARLEVQTAIDNALNNGKLPPKDFFENVGGKKSANETARNKNTQDLQRLLGNKALLLDEIADYQSAKELASKVIADPGLGRSASGATLASWVSADSNTDVIAAKAAAVISYNAEREEQARQRLEAMREEEVKLLEERLVLSKEKASLAERETHADRILSMHTELEAKQAEAAQKAKEEAERRIAEQKAAAQKVEEEKARAEVISSLDNTPVNAAPGIGGEAAKPVDKIMLEQNRLQEELYEKQSLLSDKMSQLEAISDARFELKQEMRDIEPKPLMNTYNRRGVRLDNTERFLDNEERGEGRVAARRNFNEFNRSHREEEERLRQEIAELRQDVKQREGRLAALEDERRSQPLNVARDNIEQVDARMDAPLAQKVKLEAELKRQMNQLDAQRPGSDMHAFYSKHVGETQAALNTVNRKIGGLREERTAREETLEKVQMFEHNMELVQEKQAEIERINLQLSTVDKAKGSLLGIAEVMQQLEGIQQDGKAKGNAAYDDERAMAGIHNNLKSYVGQARGMGANTVADKVEEVQKSLNTALSDGTVSGQEMERIKNALKNSGVTTQEGLEQTIGSEKAKLRDKNNALQKDIEDLKNKMFGVQSSDDKNNGPSNVPDARPRQGGPGII